MILGISNNNQKFIIQKEIIYKYFSLKNGQFLENATYKTIDFIKYGFISVLTNENKSISFFDMNNDEKVLELDLTFSIDKIIDISIDLSYILVQNQNEIQLINVKLNKKVASIQFEDILKVNIKISINNKYLIYKESKDTNQIKIFNIQNNETIIFDDEGYKSLSNIDFHILNDELIIIGTWMHNGIASHNFVRYDLSTKTILERINCSIGNRKTSYYLTNVINKDFIATLGVLGGMDSYRRFMLIKTTGEFVNFYDIYNISKFISSNDGRYLLMSNENSLYLLDFEKEINEDNILEFNSFFKN